MSARGRLGDPAVLAVMERPPPPIVHEERFAQPLVLPVDAFATTTAPPPSATHQAPAAVAAAAAAGALSSSTVTPDGFVIRPKPLGFTNKSSMSLSGRCHDVILMLTSHKHGVKIPVPRWRPAAHGITGSNADSKSSYSTAVGSSRKQPSASSPVPESSIFADGGASSGLSAGKASIASAMAALSSSHAHHQSLLARAAQLNQTYYGMAAGSNQPFPTATTESETTAGLDDSVAAVTGASAGGASVASGLERVALDSSSGAAADFGQQQQQSPRHRQQQPQQQQPQLQLPDIVHPLSARGVRESLKQARSVSNFGLGTYFNAASYQVRRSTYAAAAQDPRIRYMCYIMHPYQRAALNITFSTL